MSGKAERKRRRKSNAGGTFLPSRNKLLIALREGGEREEGKGEGERRRPKGAAFSYHMSYRGLRGKKRKGKKKRGRGKEGMIGLPLLAVIDSLVIATLRKGGKRKRGEGGGHTVRQAINFSLLT